ncbi:MAG TPA: IclR family transcriptional regulator [Vicinamibacterales bacterium]|nr:IclR family transcriptional regulator [Vicinamibacterales bacterium]
MREHHLRSVRRTLVAVRDQAPDALWVKSAERALSVLELIGQTESVMSFRELEEALDIPRSSLHGLLRTLTERGWLQRDSESGAFALGIRTWQVGRAYLRGRSLAERARPHMIRVQTAIRETVQLAVLEDRYSVYIGKVDGPQRLVVASEVGRRLEAHATGLGKVLLASLPPAELDRRLAGVKLERLTPTTITNHQRLMRELMRIRERGYALDHEEYTIGVQCVAVPIRDHTQQVAAAMSVSVPKVRFDKQLLNDALRTLTEASRDLSSELGCVEAPLLRVASHTTALTYDSSHSSRS